MNAIVRDLNARYDKVLGSPWNHNRIRCILEMPSYAGHLVWARSTQRLATQSRPEPEDRWVWKRGAFEAIIDPELYDQAQDRLRVIRRRVTKEDLINRARDLIQQHGRLSFKIVQHDPILHVATVYRLFGSLNDLAVQAGCPRATHPSVVFSNRAQRKLRSIILSQVSDAISAGGGVYDFDEERGLFVVDQQLRVAVLASRCRSEGRGKIWPFGKGTKPIPSSDLLVAVRCTRCGSVIEDYYLLPRPFYANGVCLSEHSPILDLFRSVDLAPLTRLISRISLKGLRP